MHRCFQFCVIAAFSFASFASTLQSTANAVEFGWKSLPDGGIEYQVQVEPELITTFEKQGFSSEIPPGLRDIRSIRITAGKAQLPNQGDIDGPKVVQAAVPAMPGPDKTTPANTAANNGTPNRALNEPNILGNVVPTAATDAAPLLNPNGGNPATAQPRYGAPITSETPNGSTSGFPPNSSSPMNGNLSNTNVGNGNATTGSPTNTNGNPASNGIANNPPGNNPPETTSRTSGLNEAANPQSIWGNYSNQVKSEPTPAAAPDTRSGFPANLSRENSPRDYSNRDNPAPRSTYGADDRIAASTPPAIETVNKQEVATPEAKPWMPLMLALLALFASLAANVYLVWLHQEIRFKYFSLLRRLPDGSVSTI